MLLGDSNGGKYAPTVVFKAKRSEVEETDQENLRVRHGFGRKVWKEVRAIEDAAGLWIFGNTTAWWNELQQLQFLAQHFAQQPDMSQAVLLLLDDFSGHWTAKVVAYAKETNVVVLKVPPRFTSFCHPADVSWMKPFKDKMRDQWIDFLRLQIRERRQQTTTQQPTTAFKMKSPTRTDTAEWIAAAWIDLSAETIRAGYSGAHMRTEKVQPAVSELIAELESLQVVDSTFGDIESDDDFDR
uniref:AlNc14C1323G12888 protein n=1 Tax=Albugo laibachii Nc14 TaxID=890382 RepID=F0X2N1_9STRA|nr:AlNc14C1323G12888 [Albugo laibachii Nc14]|eukprot:CCA28148.1 AlNc14C1323G12888 [Albugo laibachii Nc14]